MTQSGYNIILEWINNNQEIDKYIHRMVPFRYEDDMKQHLMIEISRVNYNKLNNMFNARTLKFLAFRIVKNHMDPDCGNCFYKKYIKPDRLSEDIGVVKSITSQDYQELSPDDRILKIEDTLRGMKPWKVNLFNMYYKDGYNFREIGEKVGMNIETVKSWIYEVRNDLKNKLTK